MRIAITGATGFLGQSLVQKLVAAEHQVVAGTRQLLSMAAPQRYSLQHLDFHQPSSLENFCAAVSTLVHLAGPDASECEANPEVIGEFLDETRAVFEAAVKAGVQRFLFVSTVHVYGGSETQVFNENSPCLPSGVYGESRLAAERMLSELAAKSTILLTIVRLSNTYGWNEDRLSKSWKLFTNEIALSALETGAITLRGNSESTRDFISIAAATQALELLMLDTKIGPQIEIWNIGSGRSLQLGRMAHSVADSVQRVTGVLPQVSIENLASAPKSCMRIDVTKALNEGLLTPVSLEHGLDSFVESIFHRLRQVPSHELG